MGTKVACLAVSLFLLVAGQATQGFAVTFFVSPSGNDSNGGGSTDPWRTLQKAADSMQPGDEVRVADGAYDGFYARRDGTALSPIVFRAEGNNAVINTNNGSTPDIINVEGYDYTEIIGFIVQGGSRAGIRVVEARGCVVRDCVVGPNQKWGIFTAYTPEIQIIDNVCFASSEQHGIYVSNSRTADDSPVIRGNECFGNGQNGIQLNGDCYASGDGIISGALIENNLVRDNNWKGFSLISVRNSIIQNNIVFNNGVAGIGAGGIHLADEPGCNNPSNDNLVVNNTIIEFAIVCMRLNNNAAGNTVFNNLAVSRSISRTIVDEDGGNAIDPASNMKLTSTSGLFVDDAGNDFHLAPGSVAADAGTVSYNGRNAPLYDYEGDARPSGTGFEIGADEYSGGGGGWQPPPSPTNSTGAIVPDGYWAVHPSRPLEVRNLPLSWTVRIFDTAGRRVKEFTNNEGEGLDWTWDFTNDHGQRVTRAMYLVRVSGPDGDVRRTGRFLVQSDQ
jgi:parallel beta-helix repeat protein